MAMKFIIITSVSFANAMLSRFPSAHLIIIVPRTVIFCIHVGGRTKFSLEKSFFMKVNRGRLAVMSDKKTIRPTDKNLASEKQNAGN